MANKARYYGEGREPSKPGGGYFQEGLKLGTDPRLTPEGNYKGGARKLSDDIVVTSGSGFSRGIPKTNTRRYGP